MPSQLEVNEVSVAYGDTTIVHDVSFVLAAGSIGCLLGPSGCGKTTLLRAIAGFEPVSRGEVRLHGRLVSEPTNTVPPERAVKKGSKILSAVVSSTPRPQSRTSR